MAATIHGLDKAVLLEDADVVVRDVRVLVSKLVGRQAREILHDEFVEHYAAVQDANVARTEGGRVCWQHARYTRTCGTAFESGVRSGPSGCTLNDFLNDNDEHKQADLNPTRAPTARCGQEYA